MTGEIGIIRISIKNITWLIRSESNKQILCVYDCFVSCVELLDIGAARRVGLSVFLICVFCVFILFGDNVCVCVWDNSLICPLFVNCFYVFMFRLKIVLMIIITFDCNTISIMA